MQSPDRSTDNTDDHDVQSRREWLRERAPDPRPETGLRERLPERPFLSDKQWIFTVMFFVGSTGAIGTALALAGFCVLILSVLEGALLGIFLSSFAVTGGATMALMSYLWFTG